MIKYILIFVSLTFFIQANTLEEEVSLAKDYSLAYCLWNFNQTAPSNDIAVAQNMYFQSMKIGYEAYKKIHHYVKNNMTNNYIFDINMDNPRENEPVYFIMCLDMYHSKEFHTEIENIVKEVVCQWENCK
ncbi:hypothetical protein CQA53_11095 [Helicobacter didelphidarum]|uniref:Uncharacterized protein n=1 Tax=Helicobacter didelphidarum TaxID=2040648 RepID=A0A3D8I4M5_9HELI|nr:T6SS amidase immunity protein Tai4 family protein [Helicobacter didelphidarum]RDU60067.1 hypothetical protein CQA53_11095 [Helicobacter didelphidarum]